MASLLPKVLKPSSKRSRKVFVVISARGLPAELFVIEEDSKKSEQRKAAEGMIRKAEARSESAVVSKLRSPVPLHAGLGKVQDEELEDELDLLGLAQLRDQDFLFDDEVFC